MKVINKGVRNEGIRGGGECVSEKERMRKEKTNGMRFYDTIL